MNLETVELTPQDFDRAAILLANAFYDNPSHQYIFQNPANREKLLCWGLRANLKLNLASPMAREMSFALVENKPPGIRKIKAMGFWHPPEHITVNFLAKLKSGWFAAPFMFGRENYQRLSEVFAAIEKVKQEVLGKKKAWYLNNMAVAQDLRRTGIGSRLLKRELREKIVPSGYPAVLMTQKQTSVEFYRHLGFKVVLEFTIGDRENAFTNWCMLFE